MRHISEKDIRIVRVKGKYGYQYPDGKWLAGPQFDEAYPFENARLLSLKTGTRVG